jgi:hypothetical protein
LKRALEHKYLPREVDEVLLGLAQTRTVALEEIAPTEKGGRPGVAYTLRG